jgi:hypothetical protein
MPTSISPASAKMAMLAMVRRDMANLPSTRRILPRHAGNCGSLKVILSM